MRIRSRQRATFIAPGLTDMHLSRAITDPERFVKRVWPTSEGQVSRIFGYTYPVAGASKITWEDAHGLVELALLDVTYLDVGDRGLEADIICARQADDEDFWDYGS